MPNLYIIAGCNGAGKTTASETILPQMLNCREFVNADNIAKGLSPFNVESVAFEAGRLMLTRISELVHENLDFAIETTLSTRSYRSLVERTQQQGYKVTLLFVWLQDVEMARERVALRVSMGGHDIPPHLIERRYHRGLQNLFEVFIPIVDAWLLVNNSNQELEHIAFGEKNIEPSVENEYLWSKIREHVTQ